GVTKWAESTEKKKLKPAVVLYAVPAGLAFMMKSEFDRLEALVPNTPIVVLSDTATSDEIMRIIGYGARGYIPTSMPFHLAVEAVRFVEAGGTFVPAGNFLAGRDRHKQPAGPSALTERQIKVLEASGHVSQNNKI